MKLKSIVLDGFKSYAHRQELNNLDPHFNAITGLNGSGKSNIFDAICFVMGITNLKKVRAEDTRDLIYKNGNAGIQRASVTLEFLNNDPSTAPPGYPPNEYPEISIARQIMTGGRQKFFFCGRVAQQSTIKQFFHSVSMNVDNPHFLVMQGTVHKLLNMKSSEVLGWIEEAAGTRMFDARKRVAENLILGKDRKLAEINKMIDEEIDPLLQSMCDEQSEYDSYLRISANLETQRKFVTAYTFWRNIQLVDSSAETLIRYKQELGNANEELVSLPKAIEELKRKIQATVAKKEAANQINSLGDAQREVQKTQTKFKQELAVIEKNKTKNKNDVKAVEAEIEKNRTKQKDFESQAKEFLQKVTELTQEKKTLEDSTEKIKESIRLASQGLQVGDQGVTLAVEQGNVESELSALKTQLAKLEADSVRVNEDLKNFERRLANGTDDIEQLKRELSKAEQQAQQAEVALKSKTNGSDEKTVIGLEQQVQELRVKKEKLGEGAHFGTFEYTPIPGTDIRKKIFGRVGDLVRVKSKDTSLALSTAAMAHLMKVVVEDDDVAQVLIEKGQMRQRTTFFPLNKVQGGHIPQQQQDAATATASRIGGWAKLALTLVEFESNFSTVMDNVFGRFFVCSNLDVANAVAFQSPKCMAVTLQGDIVDPRGIMSGGSAGNLRDLLQELAASSTLRKQGAAIDEELYRVQSTLADVRNKLQQAAPLRNAWDRAVSTVQTFRQQIEQHATSAGTSAARKQELQTRATDTTNKIKECNVKEKQLSTRLQEIQAKLARGQDQKQLEQELKTKLSNCEKRKKEIDQYLKETRSKFEEYEGQRENFKARDVDLQQRCKELGDDFNNLCQEESQKKTEKSRVDTECETIAQKLQEEKERISGLEAEYASLSARLQELHQRENEMRRVVSEREGVIKSYKDSVERAKKENNELIREHVWIGAEQSTFGQTNGPFYFRDSEKTNETLRKFEEDQKKLEVMGKRVNKKASMILEQAKKERDELVQRRDALIRDRVIILKTIEQVEDKKWRALDTMVKAVSDGFRKLFSVCLPGASCRLDEQRDDGNRLTGLEVRVAFHGKEKESLSELSGGQRSLLALCLILAILRFRPAPVYILDEVDAALDPSHTQNIGKMLKQYFQDAQFLLVSLKDGMFGNANVIYEVRNTQGYSEVHRKTNR